MKIEKAVSAKKQSRYADVPTLRQYEAKLDHSHLAERGMAVKRVGSQECGEKNQNQALLVSIITVVRNGSSTIEDCIRSVLRQTYPNIEHIIIDGGSIDGTVELIKRYENDIAFWISEPDEGISDAFNKGVAISSGDIIGILNADDMYEVNAVELSVAMHSRMLEFGFTYGGCCYLKENKPLYKMNGDASYEKKIRCTMPNLNHPTVFVKRWVYERCGLYSMEWKLAMDYEFLLRCHMSGIRGCMIAEQLAYMRLDGASDVGVKKALRECLSIAILHGCPAHKAYLVYIKKRTTSTIYKMLWAAGLGTVAQKVKLLLNRNRASSENTI